MAKVGGDVYDRWVRYSGDGSQGSIVSDTRLGPSMGLAYVVDPDRWRTGFGRRALRAVIACPAVADVERFSLGIDADNLASRRCAESAGFVAENPEPDFEGIVYHHHVRPAPERQRGSRQ